MPKRGSVQFLLLSSRMGWRVGLAAAVVALLGLLPGEGGIYHQAKTELAQSLREAAWKRAIAGDRNEEAWPWDGVAPTATTTVPRLGLSAAVNYDFDGRDSARNSDFGAKRGNKADTSHDPHLARGDVAIGDRVTVITADGSTQVYTVTGREAGAAGQSDPSPEASLSKDSCSHLNPSLAGALRLIIEAIRDAPSLEGASEEQKL
jgi:hypothetical protein